MEVELDLFSGRPNPRWSLSAEQVEELARRLAELPAAEPPTAPPALGYRGLELTNPEGAADLPRRIRIYAGVLSVTREGSTLHFRDESLIEQWLIEQARALGLPLPDFMQHHR